MHRTKTAPQTNPTDGNRGLNDLLRLPFYNILRGLIIPEANCVPGNHQYNVAEGVILINAVSIKVHDHSDLPRLEKGAFPFLLQIFTLKSGRIFSSRKQGLLTFVMVFLEILSK